MKIRIGYGLGTRSFTNDRDSFDPFIDALEELRFDSLWLSERLSGESPDPIVGLAYAAGRTRKLKFGMSVLVLPGRNPAVRSVSASPIPMSSNSLACSERSVPSGSTRSSHC
jgi:hypothetical protein